VASAGGGRSAPVLIGRESQWDAIRAAYDQARRGQLRIVLCIGEQGIGKSHLLSVAADRLASASGRILRGGASEAEAMPPYLPFLEALTPVIRDAPLEELAADIGRGASALATAFPEVADRLRSRVPLSPLPPEQARLRLFEAIGLFLAAISRRSPLVLLLDDLQWADSASLDLLAYVAGHQLSARVLILCAYQEAAVQTQPSMERALVRLHRHNRPDTIRLGPFDEAHTSQLAQELLGSHLTAGCARLLQLHSEGNPFFAGELVRSWRDSGALQQSPEGWTLDRVSAGVIPASILSVVRLRMARLSSDTIDCLRVASAIGRSFSTELLAQVVAQTPEAIEERLRTAVADHLVDAKDTGGYRFAHDIIRTCLYGEVSTARRRRLHAQIGQALEASSHGPDAQRLAELAFHYSLSDDVARGAAYSQQAAEHALAACAFEQAVAHWQAALRQLPADSDAWGKAILGSGEAMLLAAREEPAAEAFRTAAEWHAARSQVALQAQALRGLGLALWRQDLLGEAHATLEQAAALLDQLPQTAPEAVRTRVELATLLGNVLADPVKALRHAEKALQLARSLGDPRLEAPASRTMGFLLVLENRIPEGIPQLERALQLAVGSDDMAEAAECGSALAQAYVWSGQFRPALEVSRQRERHARRAQQPHRLYYVFTWLAFLAAARGDWPRAEARLDQARAQLAGAASERPSAFLHQIRGYLAYQRAEFVQAEGEFRSALEVFQHKDPLEHHLCFGMLGLTYHALGKTALAEASLREQEALIGRLRPGSLPSASAISTLALLAVGLGDKGRLAVLLPRLQACSGQHHWFLVDRILAAGEMVLGCLRAADDHLDTAESIARSQELLPELERVLRARAALIADHGGQGALRAAAALSAEAAGIARQLRLAGHRPADARPDQEPATLRANRPPTAPLTPRESEVLRLVAAGLSSRRIAEQLVLSEHTVAKHLTSIFAKLGVENRAAAAAYAIRNSLA
jgi:DNA-binding CsgD family transcriptional regulator/tetratricopeptide (TPR) repeat protein